MKVITLLLEKLSSNWPDDLMLFANSGTLLLVNKKTGRVIDTFPVIKCDGGDADMTYDEDGNEYISHIRNGGLPMFTQGGVK